MILLTNVVASRNISGKREVADFEGVLTGQICMGDHVTFHMESTDSFDSDCYYCAQSYYIFLLCCSLTKMLGYLPREAAFQF